MSLKPDRLPEGTLVCLKTGGPLMTVEDIRDDDLVSTVWFLNGAVQRDAFQPAHLNAYVGRNQPDETSALQNDLHDMCEALGLPDSPISRSPHEVFRDCIRRVRTLQTAFTMSLVRK